MITNLSVTGLDELGRKLKQLEVELKTKILREAGREAMQVVKDDMQAHAGFDAKSTESHMRDNITIKTTRVKNMNGGVMVTVGPTKPHYMKARAQEFGTIKQVASPFIRPALDYNQRAVLNILTEHIRHALSLYT